MLPSEINDYAQYISRSKADIVGRYFSNLFEDGSRCLVNDTRAGWRKKAARRGLETAARPCTSEELLKFKLDNAKVVVQRVGQRLLPFQRALHVRTMGGVRVCLHKYCQSSKGNMSSAGLQQCSHNTITRELPPAGYFDCKKPPSLLALPVLSQAAQPGLDIESSISIPRRLLIFTINFGSYDLAPGSELPVEPATERQLP